ncbi:MAG TPA: carboxymuconolactone decarboxylase family protein [Acidimicrobiales bacterium]|nr:carboxymuconolactone decarboxylase family protein [Acidimicrobiales bacterium]
MSEPVPIEVDIAALPRIRPLSYEEADPETQALWDQISSGQPDPRGSVLMGVTMWNPELYRVRTPFVSYVKDSTCLPLRDRELAILRTAWMCGADFMWAMHNEIGLQCGLTQVEIERVGAGPDHPAWTPEEAAVLRSMDELHDQSRIADATWRVLAGTYDNRQLIELITLAGSYHVMAYLMGAIGIRPPSGESPNLPENRFLFPKMS